MESFIQGIASHHDPRQAGAFEFLVRMVMLLRCVVVVRVIGGTSENGRKFVLFDSEGVCDVPNPFGRLEHVRLRGFCIPYLH